ncbi:hypothetical protein BEL04_06950 [Mucilaginibacter sp. PPCGB 2223]|uniref:HdeD family acid-resistance protein n=1 Tax=Mucilaginibacter sp. PPCGB 2223 TaxID=1886027 RepID=UPI0008259992|nr:DUF308 domain-containing protein [Mucilaginibacter sp. PPCGB 2223]OCX54007.1 hypothetical protein BEL04_06950 [Mucilaginibacter sp. PPCGB 2223]
MATIILKNIRTIVNHWWLILIGGIVMIGLGIWIIASPVQSYISLSLAFAFCMFVAGLFEVIFSIANSKSLEGWVWILISGLIDLFIGGYLMGYPVITMAVLPFIVGFWMLFRGFMAIGSAIEMRAYGIWDWGWLLVVGIIIILLALAILANPAFGIANILMWTSIAFIFSGIFRVHLSFKLKKLKP